MKFGNENEKLEFKKSTAELREGVISMTAILNKHGGGELYFGVRNDGTPLGMDISEKTLRDVSEAVSNHTEPKITPKSTPCTSAMRIASMSSFQVATRHTTLTAGRISASLTLTGRCPPLSWKAISSRRTSGVTLGMAIFPTKPLQTWKKPFCETTSTARIALGASTSPTPATQKC